MVNRKQQVRQPLDILILDRADLTTNLLQQLIAQSTFPPRIEINPRRREKRLLEIRNHPPTVLITIPQNLPMTRRKFEKAAPSPTIRTQHFGIRCIDPLDFFPFVTRHRLILDQIIKHLCVIGQRPIRDGDITVRLPHRQCTVCDVPSSLEECDCWSSEVTGLRDWCAWGPEVEAGSFCIFGCRSGLDVAVTVAVAVGENGGLGRAGRVAGHFGIGWDNGWSAISRGGGGGW